jgi:DNA-binding MarR family transcriptional regulator
MDSHTQKITNLYNGYIEQVPAWAFELNKLIAKVGLIYGQYHFLNLKKHDIGANGISVLFRLFRNHGSMTQKSLVKNLPVTKQAVTAYIASLEKKGLIKRENITKDKRRKKILLTNEGLRILQTVLPLRVEYFNKLASCINAKEAEMQIDQLNRIIAFFEEDFKKTHKKSVANPTLRSTRQ